jgi:hypothetical protein
MADDPTYRAALAGRAGRPAPVGQAIDRHHSVAALWCTPCAARE